MRFFQNAGIPLSYFDRFLGYTRENVTFSEKITSFLNDRYGAPHILKPVYDLDESAFFTLGNVPELQNQWARENSLSNDVSFDDILIAQIEEHRTEVFYDLDPFRHDKGFIRKLPGCVKKTIAWRAAPNFVNLEYYDLVVCNFPSILKQFSSLGYNTAYFFPAHDPTLDQYASNQNRDTDVLFFGDYSRAHQRRRKVLDAVASMSDSLVIRLYLNNSRYTKLAETPLGYFPPLSQVRRSKAVRRVSRSPVYGRRMYEELSRAKIVINAAIDMSLGDRGNMRCFEAMGAGCLLLSDSGDYPAGMEVGKNMQIYAKPEDIQELIVDSLDQDNWKLIGQRSHAMISSRYSKLRQFEEFQKLI